MRETVHSARPVHPLQTLTHLQQLECVCVCLCFSVLLALRACVRKGKKKKKSNWALACFWPQMVKNPKFEAPMKTSSAEM